MIRAVALYVYGDGPPPPELAYWFDWETFNVLPNSGGTRDQRAGELQRIKAAKIAYDKWVTVCSRAGGWNELAVTEEMASLFKELEGAE